MTEALAAHYYRLGAAYMWAAEVLAADHPDAADVILDRAIEAFDRAADAVGDGLEYASPTADWDLCCALTAGTEARIRRERWKPSTSVAG